MASSSISKHHPALYTILILLILLSSATSTVDQDKAECSDQLIGLATCLPYASGDAKTPSIDCCTGLKLLLQNQKKCLCVLLKDKDDPSLGLTINGTRALELPDACHTPTNITECIDILHLAPSSPEAKIFKVSSNSSSAPATKVPEHSSTANEKNDGGMGKKWFGAKMIYGILLSFFTVSLLNLMFI